MGVPIEQVVAGEADLGVLLLHGLTGTTAEMMPVAEALLGRYPLWLARVAGHETSVGELARTSWEEWYASATAGADALSRVVPRIAVVGLSMGALLAVRLAVERPDTVAGVALLSPAIAVGRPSVHWLGRIFRWLATADANLPILQRGLARLAMAKNASDIADLEVRSRHPGYRHVPLRALLNLLILQGHTRDAADAVTQPTLVMHATNDHTAPLDAAREFFDRLATPDKTMVVLERCFHVITVDCERDLVIAELERFLGRIAGQSSSTTDHPVG